MDQFIISAAAGRRTFWRSCCSPKKTKTAARAKTKMKQLVISFVFLATVAASAHAAAADDDAALGRAVLERLDNMEAELARVKGELAEAQRSHASLARSHARDIAELRRNATLQMNGIPPGTLWWMTDVTACPPGGWIEETRYKGYGRCPCSGRTRASACRPS